MFSCKDCIHKNPPKDRIITLPPPPLEERIVVCYNCKHLLYKPDVQVVTCIALGRREEDIATVSYYCPACRKPYDHVEYNRATRNTRYFRIVPAVPSRLEEVFLDETN